MRLYIIRLIVPLAFTILVAPLAAEAQPSPIVPRIGVLSESALTASSRHRSAFLQGVHTLGYVVGQPIVLEERWAEAKLARLPDLAAELVQLQVQVIVAGNPIAARAVSQVTDRLPIVLAGGDVVGTG